MKQKLILFVVYFAVFFVTSYFIWDDGLSFSIIFSLLIATAFAASYNFMTKLGQKYVAKIVTKIVKPRN